MNTPKPDIQNIPFDVGIEDPELMKKLVDITKQTLSRLTTIEQRLDAIETIIFN